MAGLPMNPLISIVVTTHRRPRLLERALESLLQQTFQDFEIVLCADEGSYETRQVAAAKLREHDLFLSVPGVRGPAQSRNIGAAIARGQWLCFLDDDDSFERDFLASASAYLDDRGSILYFDYTKLSETRDQAVPVELRRELVDQSKTASDHLFIGNFIPVNSLLLPAATAKAFPFDTRLATHEDWEWLISLKSGSRLNFRHVPLRGPVVHLAEGESRNNPADKAMVYALDFLSIYRKWPSSDREIRSARGRVLASLGVGVSEDML